jgi:hypothetical protein
LKIKKTIKQANQFIDRLESSNGFRLFERSDVSSYARCFAIFIKSLLKQFDWLKINNERLTENLNIDLFEIYQDKINKGVDWRYDKSFLQLFCFTLSCLNILDRKLSSKNFEIFNKILDIDVLTSLKKKGVDQGLGQSGNYSMFIATFNIYANDFLKIDRSKQINDWLNLNINSINNYGFWGKKLNMDYLQFQNGYHQYEIFEYLKINNVPWNEAAKSTLLLADKYGHFAPYPGGGGCYDYDAIFMLTSEFVDDIGQLNVLKTSLNSILNDQNLNGGFCESKHIKYHKLPNIKNIISHILYQPSHVRLWSIYMNLNLCRFKHNHIITHWTTTNRRWDESNAWDTFFRLSTIYRICNYLNLEEKNLFQINDFPGIG